MTHVFIEALTPDPSFFLYGGTERTTRICEFLFPGGEVGGLNSYNALKAYKHAAMSKTRAYEWVSRFKSGQTSLEDSP